MRQKTTKPNLKSRKISSKTSSRCANQARARAQTSPALSDLSSTSRPPSVCCATSSRPNPRPNQSPRRRRRRPADRGRYRSRSARRRSTCPSRTRSVGPMKSRTELRTSQRRSEPLRPSRPWKDVDCDLSPGPTELTVNDQQEEVSTLSITQPSLLTLASSLFCFFFQPSAAVSAQDRHPGAAGSCLELVESAQSAHATTAAATHRVGCAGEK